MNASSNISLIIFALLAVFVIWKLRSVLGTRTGHERPPYDPFDRSNRQPDPSNAPPESGKIVRLPGSAPATAVAAAAKNTEFSPERWRGYAQPGSHAWAGLDAISAADPSFEPKGFLSGALSAYEMIISAFSSGDRTTLRNLLSSEVFESFEGAIAERETRGEKKETTIVSAEPGALDDAQLKDNVAQISVRFVSKLITAARDRNGAVIDGSPDKVVDHTDLWTFARSVTSSDPNWKVVATQSAS